MKLEAPSAALKTSRCHHHHHHHRTVRQWPTLFAYLPLRQRLVCDHFISEYNRLNSRHNLFRRTSLTLDRSSKLLAVSRRPLTDASKVRDSAAELSQKVSTVVGSRSFFYTPFRCMLSSIQYFFTINTKSFHRPTPSRDLLSSASLLQVQQQTFHYQCPSEYRSPQFRGVVRVDLLKSRAASLILCFCSVSFFGSNGSQEP